MAKREGTQVGPSPKLLAVDFGSGRIPAGRNSHQRFYGMGYAAGFAEAQRKAILILRPVASKEEERDCKVVAAQIAGLLPWPNNPEYGERVDIENLWEGDISG